MPSIRGLDPAKSWEQCSPGAPAGGGPAKFWRTGGRGRPGAGGERPSGPWGLIPVLGWAGRRPAASGSGRRDHCAGEVATLWGRRVRQRATTRWDRGGKHLSWLSGGSAPDLAVAAAGGVHGRSMERGVARHGMRRAATLLWVTSVPACDQKTDDDVSRCMRRPRQECTTGRGTEPTGGSLGARPATRREEGGKL
jgi:hypothetical protein